MKRKAPSGRYGRNLRRRLLNAAGYAAGQYVGNRIRNYFGMNGNGSQTRTYIGGSGVTSQFDRKVQYRKKSMPRWKKRRWLKFVKKVRAASFGPRGSSTILRNDQLTVAHSTGQAYAHFVLYGKDGIAPATSRCGYDDMKSIVNNEITMDSTQKIMFTSGVIDITMSNNSSLESTDPNLNLTLEVDVYELVFTKQADALSIGTMITDAETNTQPINVTQNQITLATRGATLFDLPDLLGRGIKILKKTKYILGKGDAATYQYRDPRNFYMRKDIIDNSDDNFVVPWKTRGFVVVSKGIAQTGETGVFKVLNIGVTRKYMYKTLEPDNVDLDNVI